ncbi:undecaprenyldiphospho-muramoylpentapeptide beta-N-acetylglucosaminyltransferase [Lacticaseibacillus yichunensis]|uniref:UDP-N-acetylglucosamine--N-acetylmuramyl-(pentapeptide) pyrophosphoryl-undecaprenol N-acetylglucosamine transferase n=1 Tax=Lacticaseibacillus yichunensis TaxID=2486015 RepID=A0ABW4CP38_9LACO|nr:undecaprenyldiphospho-muramoylpentapeptide beta-N-acetylglucosaminyltransferase [Lacticaseibacillus yichunensis]
MRLVVSGGGTGGHIYPALALIDQLKKEGKLDAVLYVGTHRGLESRIVPDAGIPFQAIELQGFKRSLSLSNFKTIQMFLSSVGKAKKVLADFRPDVVVGTGGYVAGGVLFAATQMHIPTVVHESNSVAGLTNKFLSHFVDKVGIAFPEVAAAFPAKKVVMVGNPRAQQVAGLQPNDRLAEFELDPKRRTLLIFGGSRGAPAINRAALASVEAFGDSDFQTLFVTGRAHYDAVMAEVGTLPANFKIAPYIDDMPAILPDVALVVSRSGATSLAELTALGIPSVLIPSPNVTHDHQTVNAQSMADAGAAVLLTEPELPAKFTQTITALLADDGRLNAMAKAAAKLGVPDATDRLIAVLEDVIK